MARVVSVEDKLKSEDEMGFLRFDALGNELTPGDEGHGAEVSGPTHGVSVLSDKNRVDLGVHSSLRFQASRDDEVSKYRGVLFLG